MGAEAGCEWAEGQPVNGSRGGVGSRGAGLEVLTRRGDGASGWADALIGPAINIACEVVRPRSNHQD
eukprot:scaffold11481_cov100-Isochrysis_galbana.AAC.2